MQDKVRVFGAARVNNTAVARSKHVFCDRNVACTSCRHEQDASWSEALRRVAPRLMRPRRTGAMWDVRARMMVGAGVACVALTVALWVAARQPSHDTARTQVASLAPMAPADGTVVAADEVEFTETGLLAGVTLRGSALAIPVLGISDADLRDSFAQPRANDRRHAGIDIGAPMRTPVAAAMDGWIYSISNGPTGGLGLHMVDRTGRWLLYYAHLDGYAEGLYVGQAVRRGELLGYVGATGNTRGWPHLHFEVGRLLSPGEITARPVNPYDFLQGRISAP